MNSTVNVPRAVPPRRAPVWWRRPWIAPLMTVAAAFLAFSVPPYLTFDPSLSRLEPPEGNDLYYPLLVAHVLFGTVAMVTACFQIWPAFRTSHLRGHRITGRLYVFAGALPAGVLGLYIGWHMALRMARRRRYDDHRRWMSRSFALSMSIVLSRVVNIVATIVLLPELGTTFKGSQELLQQSAASIGVWLSPLLLLLFTDWMLERRKPRRSSLSATVGDSR
jgi:hypothetical protein